MKKAIAEQNSLTFEEIGNSYSGAWLESDYGQIKQRWLLVRSEQAKKREQYTLDKRMLKDSIAAQKSFNKLNRQRFSCVKDANKALQTWIKAHAFIHVTDRSVIEHGVFRQSGRPKKGQLPECYKYQLSGALAHHLTLEQRSYWKKACLC